MGHLTKQEEHGSKVWYWVLATAILILVLYMYGQMNTAFLYMLSNALPPLTGLLAFSMAGLASRRSWIGWADVSSKVWLGYASGMFLWFLGETISVAYPLLLHIPTPFPSVGDVFWLAGYIPLLSVILLQVWPFREAFSRGKFAAVLVFVIFLMILVLAVLVPPSIAEEHETAAVLVSLAYPLLDAVLLTVAILSFVFFMKGSLWRPMLFVVAGIILNTSADVLYSWTVLLGIYYDGHPLELLFHWSYLAFALGFYLQLKQARSMIDLRSRSA